MKNRTVIITGATGLLGRQVSRVFRLKGWKVKGTGYSRADGVDILKVDLGDDNEMTKLLEETKPDAIVHCAAERFPDKVEKDPEGARKLNVTATSTLAQAAAAREVLFIYISTDYVFAGRPGEAPYQVDAETSPPNVYGQTKLEGEEAVLAAYSGCRRAGSAVVLRVPVLYGSAETPSESAVNVLLEAVWKSQTEGKKIAMDDWAPRYPTNTEDVGRVCLDVAEHYLDAGDDAAAAGLPRILHFSSEDRMTKYEMCQKFAEIMGISADNLEPNTDGQSSQASVQRPYDTHLDTRALKELGIELSTCDFVAWWRRELGGFRR